MGEQGREMSVFARASLVQPLIGIRAAWGSGIRGRIFPCGNILGEPRRAELSSPGLMSTERCGCGWWGMEQSSEESPLLPHPSSAPTLPWLSPGGKCGICTQAQGTGAGGRGGSPGGGVGTGGICCGISLSMSHFPFCSPPAIPTLLERLNKLFCSQGLLRVTLGSSRSAGGSGDTEVTWTVSFSSAKT